MTTKSNTEGLQFARLLMVVSSLSPLFILWAIRGNNLIPDVYFILACALLVLIPNTFLWLRILIARKNNVTRKIVVGKFEDHRNHLLIYLFAMLLPIYAVNLNDWRDFAAAISALIFIILLFWQLNLHYMNLAFILLGYRVFTLFPMEDGNPFSGKESWVIITHRKNMSTGEKLTACRLSNTVYIEVN